MNSRKWNPLHRMNNWKIRQKLMVSFGLLLALMVIFSTLGLASLRRAQSSFQIAVDRGVVIERKAHEIDENLLRARRNEKDFFLRWHSEGFDAAHQRYILPAIVELTRMRQEITALQPLVAGNRRLEKMLVQLRENADIYETELRAVVDLLEQRGFEDTGLEGELRAAVRTVEESFYEKGGHKALQVTLLQLRRHEKDYLLRGDDTHVKKVISTAQELKRQITASSLSRETKLQDFQLLDDYLVAFENLVAIDRKIAERKLTLQQAAETIEPLAENLAVFGQQNTTDRLSEARKLNDSISFNLNVGLLVIVLTGAAMAFLLGRQIAEPIRALAHATRRVTSGDLQARAEIDQRDEVGETAAAFNQMVDQLAQTLDTLEERVIARTARLETAASLGEQLVSILNLDDLFMTLVNQIKTRFGYYHAHIYLLDEAQKQLVVQAGTGEAGAEMRARRHSIPLDAPTSLVARAARSGQIVRVDNVRESEDWLPNPLLPNTYSEMAVPILLEGKVVGVLDVQQDRIAGLDEGDAGLLRTLANQAAVAIRNARLFAQTQKELDELRTLQAEYTAQSWDRQRLARRHQGRVIFSLDSRTSLDEATIAHARRLALKQQTPTLVPIHNSAAARGNDSPPRHALVAPIKLGERPIGNLQLHDVPPTRPFTDDEEAIVRAVIEQVAQIAETLRLFEETQERASRERLISNIGDRMRRAPDMETLMQVTLSELNRVLGTARSFIRLDHPATRGGNGDANGGAPQPASTAESSAPQTDPTG